MGGGIAVDMRGVKRRMEAVVARSRDGVEKWLRGMPGCSVYQEHARFESPHEIRLKDLVISAERIFLNVGGRANVRICRGSIECLISRIPRCSSSKCFRGIF